MNWTSVKPLRTIGLALSLVGGTLLHGGPAPAHEDEKGDAGTGAGAMTGAMQGPGHMDMEAMPGMRLMMPRMDPKEGRRLFVSKGCVACHAVNGVGGHDATGLDAHTMNRMMNPFEFAAKMWRMAPAMIYAQEEALGEQILFTGDELAAIVAFVHSDEAQHEFSEADLTPMARKMMDHSHGEATTGPEAHAEELGHMHKGMMGDDHDN